MVWLGFMAYHHCRLFDANLLYTYILDLYNLVWFGFMAYQPL